MTHGGPKSLAAFDKAVTEFMNLPLEAQAEHFSRFATSMLIPGPSGLAKLSGVGKGISALDKIAKNELKALRAAAQTSKLEVVTLNGVQTTKSIAEKITALEKAAGSAFSAEETFLKVKELEGQLAGTMPVTSAFAKGVQDATTKGTVWENIKATQPYYSDTCIPKSFELKIGGHEFWVHPNATEHMADFIKRRPSHGIPMRSQEMLTSFSSAVEQAFASGIKYKDEINIGQWQLSFSAPRQPGLLPVIHHALFKP